MKIHHMIPGVQEAQQWFEDVRFYVKMAALFTVLQFFVLAVTGAVIAYQMWRIASRMEEEHQRRKAHLTTAPPFVATPNNPYPPRRP